MPLDRPSVTTIYNRVITGIESRLTDDSALLRRAVLRILAKVFAGAVHLLYGNLEFLSQQIMVDQAEDSWLDRHGLMWGITRKAAAYASGSVTFTGINGIIIPEGTLVQTSEGVQYETDADATIAVGSATIGIVAIEAGEDGNYDGATIELVSPITDIDSAVSVVSPGFSGGVSEETDDDYRARILEHIQTPPMGGTAADYVVWAKSDEVPITNGVVQKAWCFPIAVGPGTVDVVITAAGSTQVASPALIADVQAYIDTVRPVTADVVVKTVDVKDIDMDIEITPNTLDLRNTITSNLQDLINESATPGSNLLIALIRDAIMDSGVDNYAITAITVDATPVPVDDIVLIDYEFPVWDNLNFSTL